MVPCAGIAREEGKEGVHGKGPLLCMCMALLRRGGGDASMVDRGGNKERRGEKHLSLQYAPAELLKHSDRPTK